MHGSELEQLGEVNKHVLVEKWYFPHYHWLFLKQQSDLEEEVELVLPILCPEQLSLLAGLLGGL